MEELCEKKKEHNLNPEIDDPDLLVPFLDIRAPDIQGGEFIENVHYPLRYMSHKEEG